MPQTGPLMSLIVLPFVNLSGDARQDYLVDSVTDHMTAELGRIENSFVVNHATATAYRGDALDVTEIGRELGVRYAIKGTIRPASGGLRVNTQLIDTANGQHLWIDRFDIAFCEPFAMQHDIVNRLIPPLHTHLLGASGRAPQSAPAPRAARPAQGGATVVHPRGIPAPVDARAAAHIIAGQPAMRAAPASPRAVVAPPPAVPRRPPMGLRRARRSSWRSSPLSASPRSPSLAPSAMRSSRSYRGC
jgi:TolB-like protein